MWKRTMDVSCCWCLGPFLPPHPHAERRLSLSRHFRGHWHVSGSHPALPLMSVFPVIYYTFFFLPDNIGFSPSLMYKWRHVHLIFMMVRLHQTAAACCNCLWQSAFSPDCVVAGRCRQLLMAKHIFIYFVKYFLHIVHKLNVGCAKIVVRDYSFRSGFQFNY